MKDTNKFVTSDEAWKVFKSSGNIEAFILYRRLKEMEASREIAPTFKDDKLDD